MSPHYRHTQIGWVTLASLIGVAGLASSLVPLAAIPTAGAITLALVAAVLLLFTTLTVEVDAAEIRLGFTGWLIRRRIALSELASVRVVRNHWLSGWGIRLIPGGWMWNVSGLDAIELVLRNGRVFRIGTDEQQALLQAIERVAPEAATNDPRRSRGLAGETDSQPAG
jgi:hypothetical protein